MNIMVNTYNFNSTEYYESLKRYLKPSMKVVIIPFASELKYFTQEGHFNNLYHPEYGKDFKILSKAFHNYGIEKEHIYVLNPFRDTIKFMKYKIKNADVILFTGGNFIECGDYLKATHLFDTVKEFKGITMIASYDKFNIFLK